MHVATQLLISDSSVNFCLLTPLSDRWSHTLKAWAITNTQKLLRMMPGFVQNTVFIQAFHFICSSFMKQEMCLSSARMLSLFALTVITLLFTENGSSQRFVCHKQAFQHLAFLAYAFDGDLFTTSKTQTELYKIITVT